MPWAKSRKRWVGDLVRALVSGQAAGANESVIGREASTGVVKAAALGAPSVPDLLVILGACAVVAMLLQRIRLAVIPGFLLTGALVGPHAFGLVSSPEHLDEISHLAIVLLMFGVGLQLHVDALKHHFVRMVAIGVLSCFASVGLAIPVALLFGLSGPASLAVAMGFSLSSTAVVLRLLTQRREMEGLRGRMSLAILVVQDLIVLAMLASIPALAKWAGAEGIEAADEGTIWQGIAGWQRFFLDQSLRLGGVVLLLFAFRYLAPKILSEALRGRSLEVLTISALASAFTFAAAVEYLGFSLEMGAFLAGFLLASTPYRDHLAAQLRPMRDVLIAVFFTTVGMKIQPGLIWSDATAILSATAILLVLKTFAIGGACWAMGTRGGIALATGLALSQAGEFSLVFLDLAGQAGVLDSQLTGSAIAIVVLSLVLTPGLVAAGPRVVALAHGLRAAPWFRHELDDSGQGFAEQSSERPRVVVAGFGIVGRCVVDNLERLGYTCVVAELNHRTVRRESAKRTMVFGDISNDDILESMAIETCAAVVLTIPDADAVARACRVIRRRNARIPILARSSLLGRTRRIEGAGANAVAVDELACADAMLGLVMQRIVGPGTRPAQSSAGLDLALAEADLDLGVADALDAAAREGACALGSVGDE